MKITSYISFLNKINQKITPYNRELVTNLRQIENLVREPRNELIINIQAAVGSFQSIRKLMLKVDFDSFTQSESKVVNAYNWQFLFGDNGQDYIRKFIEKQTIPMAALEQFVNSLRDLVALSTHYPFIGKSLQVFQDNILPGEGTFEIIFSGETEILNISNAKKQIEDWFMILRGYGIILNGGQDDFDIISIEKNSPTLFKIKANIKKISLVAFLSAQLLVVQKEILGKKIAVEQMKNNFPKEIVDSMLTTLEDEIRDSVNKKLNIIIETKLSDYLGKEVDIVSIKNELEKALKNHYSFYEKGGDTIFLEHLQDKINDEENYINDIIELQKEIKSLKESGKVSGLISKNTNNGNNT